MASYKIKDIEEDDPVGRIIHDEFANELCDNFILVGEEETGMPGFYVNFAESIRNFEVRDSDIMVCTYPKSGTTWTQEMVWLIANDLDYEGAKAQLDERFPFLELCTLYDYEKKHKIFGKKSPEYVHNSLEYTRQLSNPRFIKTHLPFYLLPQDIQNGSKSPKMIYVTRNPKDVCVSYYHHGKILQGWRANLENFSKVFMSNKIMWGSFWKHVLGYWERRNSPNLLIITYEDMKKDLQSVIQKVANFLNKKLTDEQIERLSKHLSFDAMKNNSAVNLEDVLRLQKGKHMWFEDGKFIRSGVVGKYKEEMSSDTIREFDAWIRENIEGTSFGQQYDYNL